MPLHGSLLDNSSTTEIDKSSTTTEIPFTSLDNRVGEGDVGGNINISNVSLGGEVKVDGKKNKLSMGNNVSAQTGQSGSAGGAGAIQGGTLNIDAVDFNAVDGGLGVAAFALDSQRENNNEAFEFLAEVNARSAAQNQGILSEAMQLAGESTRSETAQAFSLLSKYGLWIIGGLGGVYIVGKFWGKR